MILPDDKNPTIVWDAEKKKWINTDEREDSHENFVPPPKTIESMSFQYQQQEIIQQTQSASIPTNGLKNTFTTSDPQEHAQPKPSGLQSNMFKMQRNRSMKHFSNLIFF